MQVFQVIETPHDILYVSVTPRRTAVLSICLYFILTRFNNSCREFIYYTYTGTQTWAGGNFFNEIINSCNARFRMKLPPPMFYVRMVNPYLRRRSRRQRRRKVERNDSCSQSCHNSYFSDVLSLATTAVVARVV